MDREPLMFQIEVAIFLVAFVMAVLYPIVRYWIDDSYRQGIGEREVYERDNKNDLNFRLMGYADEKRLIGTSVYLKVSCLFLICLIFNFCLLFYW